ncbi:hypothetical protein SBC2_77180 (plasmid) [Caballeronia sp. SBC2]|nr:hypothetical protein SBC2_77180 [Caballeronia sp. SBC2]
MVLSMKTSSKSASTANASKTSCHMPLRDHRAKRMYTLFQRPNSAGKSRHGAPVRAIHSTASTNSRLSAAVRPRSPALPGSNNATRSYWSSRNIIRGMPVSPKRQDVSRFPEKLTAKSASDMRNVNTPFYEQFLVKPFCKLTDSSIYVSLPCRYGTPTSVTVKYMVRSRILRS